MVPNLILFLESIGGGEILVILLFVLLFFGSKKIPDLARGLGKGMREVKDAMNGVQTEIRSSIREVEKVVEDEPEQKIGAVMPPKASVSKDTSIPPPPDPSANLPSETSPGV